MLFLKKESKNFIIYVVQDRASFFEANKVYKFCLFSPDIQHGVSSRGSIVTSVFRLWRISVERYVI